jgi:hypothetical protein
MIAVIAAVLTTVQPVLGPFAFFRPGDGVNYELLHLVVGGLIYNAAILLILLASFTRLRWRGWLFGLSILQYALTHLQLRLGLGSNDDASLLAFHIPVGVAIFALAWGVAVLSFKREQVARQ